MDRCGFVPMSLAAALMLIIAIVFAAQVASSGSHISRLYSDPSLAQELFSSAAAVRCRLEGALRCSAYAALSEVCERAWELEGRERVERVEELTRKYFWSAAEALGDLCASCDGRVELTLPSPPDISADEIAGGCVRVSASMPPGTEIRVASRDGSAEYAVGLGDISVDLDSRYFLLENLMENFRKGMGSVNTLWGTAEYLWAWGEAWGPGVVRLGLERSSALFEAAWCVHELNTFGSVDWSAAAAAFLRDAFPPGLRTAEGGLGVIGEVSAIREWIGGARSVLSQEGERIAGVLRTLGDAKAMAERDNVRAAGDLLKSAASALAASRESLLRLRGSLARDLESSPGSISSGIVSGLPGQEISTYDQLSAGLDGLIQRIARAGDEIALGLSGGNPAECADRAALELMPLIKASGEVRSVEVQIPYQGRAVLPVFIDSADSSSLPRLMKILEGMDSDVRAIEGLPLSPGCIPEGFASALGTVSGFTRAREELCSIFPPPPLKGDPGVSVFHDLKVKEVRYRREDPAGLAGLQVATPIPLWFIGVTVWWGQWEIVLRLDNWSRETIFDYGNRTVPSLTELGAADLPLRYAWRFDGKEFRVRVVVACLKPFIVQIA